MGQTILTRTQKEVLSLMAEEIVMSDFYLSGGTALAEYYIHHRLSDDLDFFTENDIDMSFIHGFSTKVKEIIGATEVEYQRLYDRNIFLFHKPDGEELKIEWTKYPFKRLDTGMKVDGMEIDSLRDISANKLMAMLDRFDPKDFVDLYFLLQKSSLNEIKTDTERKFSVKIEPLFLGSELSKVKRIAALPKMMEPLKIEDLKLFFTNLAKTLSGSILEDA